MEEALEMGCIFSLKLLYLRYSKVSMHLVSFSAWGSNILVSKQLAMRTLLRGNLV